MVCNNIDVPVIQQWLFYYLRQFKRAQNTKENKIEIRCGQKSGIEILNIKIQYMFHHLTLLNLYVYELYTNSVKIYTYFISKY